MYNISKAPAIKKHHKCSTPPPVTDLSETLDSLTMLNLLELVLKW